MTEFKGASKRDILASFAVYIKPMFDITFRTVWNPVYQIYVNNSFCTPEKQNRITEIISHEINQFCGDLNNIYIYCIKILIIPNFLLFCN